MLIGQCSGIWHILAKNRLFIKKKQKRTFSGNMVAKLFGSAKQKKILLLDRQTLFQAKSKNLKVHLK